MNVLPAAGPHRRRTLALLGLTVVVLAAVAWREFGDAAPASPPAPASNSQAPATLTPAVRLPLPEPLQLAALEPVPGAPQAGRNPFRYGVPPAPPRPAVTAPPPVASAPSAPQAPLGPPPVPPIQLKALGVMGLSGGQKIVGLKDPATGTVFRAAEGQIVDGRYRVVKIGVESVVVSYLDGTGQRAIPFGG